jgi:glycosyltransferase involved in cell wall biosynthesis
LVGPFENNVDPVPEDVRRRIGENPAIITAGELTGIDLLAWYAASDCFVLPSYREGFPNTVIEAGAMGLPSIVTDINGSNEIISDSVNGLIVPPKDSEALFNAMRKMLDDNIFRESSSVCREMIASRFEQGYVRGCLYSFYDFFVNFVDCI